jgi:hypothetical protein
MTTLSRKISAEVHLTQITNIWFFNTFSSADIYTLKSTVPGHFTTLWKSQSTSTPSGQLVSEATEYIYSARAESVKLLQVNNNINLKYAMSYYCGIVLSVKVCNMDNVLVWHSEVYVWGK